MEYSGKCIERAGVDETVHAECVLLRGVRAGDAL